MELFGKRLVILGCGYLGKEILGQALGKGMRVSALTRNREDLERVRGLGLEQVVEAELHGRKWHDVVEVKPDVAVICAGAGGRGLVGYRESYLGGVGSVLDWAKERGRIGSVIFTSSTSVYAQSDEKWVTESDPAEGSSPGAEILREAELLLEKEREEVGRGIVLRLGGIYGPGRHHLLDRARAGEILEEEGDSVFLNSVRVEDAAAAVLAAAASSVSGGIFNIVDDLPERRGEVLRYLREEVERRGISGGVSGKVPVMGRRSGRRPSRRISNEKAKEVLRWEPRYPDYRSGYAGLIG